MELLAPAGSIEMLKMAVRHGADAVYLGLPTFSARAKSKEFTSDNLSDHVAYCHKFGVKVYLTLNTIVRQSEMRKALSAAEIAEASGVDGVLLQDLGLAKLTRRHFPGLPLHASTQMGVHNVPGAQYARDAGFSRVVLARETPLADMRAIKEETGLEVEVFVHGALCVSFSGNCYYSYLVSGNSGNRGKCLQLCRKNYRAISDGKENEGSLLSLPDLCLIDELDALRQAGVDSLKIEGRLKRPEYVGVVLDAYRKALRGDVVSKEDRESLLTIFNRGGFCRGYLDGDQPDFAGRGSPNHAGVPIGTVAAVERTSVIGRSDRVLSPEDGFKIIRDGKEVGGASHPKSLGDGLYRFSTADRVRIGDRIYRTTDAKQLTAQYEEERKIPLEIEAEFREGHPARLTGKIPGREITVYGTEPLALARQAALTRETATESLCKTGGTDYRVVNCAVVCEPVFMAKSVLNGLRRELLAQTDKSFYAQKSNRIDAQVSMNAGTRCQGTALRYYACHTTEELDHIKKAAGKNCAFVYSPDDYRVLPKGDRDVYLQLPTIAMQRDLELIRKQKDAIVTYAGVVADNVYGIVLAREFELPVIGGFGLNIANYEWETDFYDIFFSVENSGENDAVAFGLGEYPFMTVAHCPYKSAFGGDCAQCKGSRDMTYRDERNLTLRIRRKRTARCYFLLCGEMNRSVGDLRNRRLYADVRTLSDAAIRNFERENAEPRNFNPEGKR